MQENRVPCCGSVPSLLLMSGVDLEETDCMYCSTKLTLSLVMQHVHLTYLAASPEFQTLQPGSCIICRGGAGEGLANKY